MKVLNEWSDDHIACCDVVHNGHAITLNWCGEPLVTKLRMVEEGDITLEKACKNLPGLLAVFNNPMNANFASTDEGYVDTDEEEPTPEHVEYQCDAGYVVVSPWSEKLTGE